MFRNNVTKIHWACCLAFLTVAFTCGPLQADEVITTGKLISAKSDRGGCLKPENVIDGDTNTVCRMTGPNTTLTITIDLTCGYEISGIEIISGKKNPIHFCTGIKCSGNNKTYRPIISRKINLPMWRGGDSEIITFTPAVARYVQISFFTGNPIADIAEIKMYGRKNIPERHMLMWAGNIQTDYLDKLDFFEKEMGLTDLWIDFVQTGFPQSNYNSGFAIWKENGIFDKLKTRGIRYWLGEHEAFCTMVRSPEELRDEALWITTLDRMKQVYAEARKLGFTGIVYDAEDYTHVYPQVAKKYASHATHVSPWSFNDEYGLGGMYYHRGIQIGKVIKASWPEAIVIQLNEQRMYFDKPKSRDGNYWWLKGISDVGVEIWVATEKTYGAGNGEIKDTDLPEHVRRWFVDLDQFVKEAHEAYPFAKRIIPGFHPWNIRIQGPAYLPKYLDQQLSKLENLSLACWIYTEGNSRGGDPRILKPAKFKKYGIKAQDFIDVFRKHPTKKKIK